MFCKLVFNIVKLNNDNLLLIVLINSVKFFFIICVLFGILVVKVKCVYDYVL